MYGKTTHKLATIQYVNSFLLHDAIGEHTKWNILDTDRYLKGIEIGFSNKIDAIHFKLGFNQDGQEITSFNYGASGEKEKGV